MLQAQRLKEYSNLQTFLLVALRVIIGWYFLYEGIVKIANPDWSSFGYLMDSQGIFAKLFHNMAANNDVVAVVDWLNKWGLTMIGLGLMLGLLTQIALVSGILMLIMYYCSHPPLASITYMMPQEGSYLWVNKTLIEIFTMAVLMVFPTGHIIGIDRFISKWTKKQQQ
jgi:thiosulfate dehydrogenase (quinone) large subunit